jgi:hypothetical protein
MGRVGTDCGSIVVKYLPVLTGNFQELRQWTLRQKALQPIIYVSPPPDIQEMRADFVEVGGGLDLGLPRYFEPEFDPIDPQYKMDLKVFEDDIAGRGDLPDCSAWDDIERVSIKGDREIDFSDMLL